MHGTYHILRFKLRMIGAYIDGTAIMLNDNEKSVNKSSKIKSTLNRKHISIPYYLVRQNIAAGVVNIGWISTSDNIAEALTNRLRGTNKKNLFRDWTY